MSSSQAQELAQKNLFQKAKLINFLIENYMPFPTLQANVPSKYADEVTINRTAARGLLMNSLNAIRLQSSCQSPNSFLRQFLSTHPKWNDFQSILTVGIISRHWDSLVFTYYRV